MTPRLRAPFWLALASLGLLATTRSASACAVCAAGDPTLYAMGAETAFQGRFRGAATLRAGEAWTGERGIDGLVVFEQRLDLALLYAPWRDISFSVDAPLLHRSTYLDGGPSTAAFVLGDVELRARDLAWTWRSGAERRTLAFHAGFKVPTAPVERDGLGRLLPPDLQPGCASLVPFAGAAFSMATPPVVLLLGATLYVDFGLGGDTPHPGDSLRTQAVLQFQPRYWLATRVGWDMKLEEPGTTTGDVIAPDSGGVVGYTSTEVFIVPKVDWMITAGAYFPVLQALRGEHGEGVIGSVSLTVDL